MLSAVQVAQLKSQLQETIVENAKQLGFEDQEVRPKVVSESNLFALYEDVLERLWYYSNLKSLVLLVDNAEFNLRTIKKQTLENYKAMLGVLLLKYKEQVYTQFAKTHINEGWLKQLSMAIDQAAKNQTLSELNIQFQVYTALIAEIKDMLEIMGLEFKFLQTLQSLDDLKRVFESVIEDYKQYMMSKYSNTLGIVNVSKMLSNIQSKKYYDRLVKHLARDIADELEEQTVNVRGGKKFTQREQPGEDRDQQREEIRKQVKKDQQQEIKAQQEEAERVRREKEAQAKRAEEEETRTKQKQAEAERKMKEEFARQQEEILRKQREQREREQREREQRERDAKKSSSATFTFQHIEGCKTIADIKDKERCKNEFGKQLKAFGREKLVDSFGKKSATGKNLRCLLTNNVFRLLTDFVPYNSRKPFDEQYSKQGKMMSLGLHPDKSQGKDYKDDMAEFFTLINPVTNKDKYADLTSMLSNQCE